MGIAIISDIHVRSNQDEAYRLLLSFLDQEKVRNAQMIILLGDIFDLMCGSYPEYRDLFKEFFDKIDEIYAQGEAQIHYFEGNHDFHLGDIFKEKVVVHNQDWQTTLWGKKFYFSHGDEFFPGEYGYQIYKKILQSKPIHFLLSEHIVPYDVFKKIGDWTGQKTKYIKRDKSLDFTKIRERFRLGVMTKQSALKADYIICGHSHVKDDFIFSNKNYSFRYLNNGYALESKTFLYLEEDKIDFIYI